MKETRVTVLPTDLKNEIDRLELTRIQKEKAYRLCELIFEKQFRDAHGYDSYVDLPQEYLRKILGGGNYHLLLDKLKPDVIETEGYFNAHDVFIECYSNSDGNGQSKRYRIKPKFLGSDFEPAIYQHRANEGDNGQIKLACECFNKSVVYNDLSWLIINRHALIQRTKEHIGGICGENFTVDADVKETFFKVKDQLSGYNGYTTLEVSLQRAKLNNVSLIKDKRKFILGDLQKYINQRKQNTKFSYLRSIEKLGNPKCFYANRNPENNRLDHNLTSVSSNLLEVIKADNDLCEIDMSNSQFAILAWLIRNDEKFVSTPDFELFAEQASRGLLYEYVRDEYNLPDRKNGKSMMFELAFSSHKNNSTDKCKLKKLFPAVVKYCDAYKIEHGDNKLAIWLQKEEAKLFIDYIYYKLKQQGLWVLTRHDSLVVKNSDRDRIKAFVENYFSTIELDCNIEIK